MSKPITIELDPGELNILAGWASDYFKSPTDGNHPQAQRLALDIMSANARYMTAALPSEDANAYLRPGTLPNGVQLIEDEHADVPYFIDVSSWKILKP